MVDHFSESQIADIFQVFRHFDVGHDGKISLADIARMMLALGHNPTTDELQGIIHHIHPSGKTYVDFPEFLTMLAFHVQKTEPEEQLRDAFKVFDSDGNGNINADELKRTMTTLGETLSAEDVDYIVKMADVDGDGQVNYEEFIRVMTSK